MSIDIDLPTPVEMAERLKSDFTDAQAEAIAAEIYQPLRDFIRNDALKGVDPKSWSID